MALLGSQHQGRTQKGTYAGRPAQREDHTEQHCRKEAHVPGISGLAAAPEQIQPEHAEKIQSEEDHHQAGNQIYCRLVLLQEAAEGTRQSAHGHKDCRKACHEAQSPGNGFPGAAFAATGKIGNVDGQHGQQAG